MIKNLTFLDGDNELPNDTSYSKEIMQYFKKANNIYIKTPYCPFNYD